MISCYHEMKSWFRTDLRPSWEEEILKRSKCSLNNINITVPNCWVLSQNTPVMSSSAPQLPAMGKKNQWFEDEKTIKWKIILLIIFCVCHNIFLQWVDHTTCYPIHTSLLPDSFQKINSVCPQKLLLYLTDKLGSLLKCENYCLFGSQLCSLR